MANKIVQFPKGNITPTNMVAQMMENNPEVVIVIARHGGEWKASWSSCDLGDLVWAAKILDLKVDAILNGEHEAVDYG